MNRIRSGEKIIVALSGGVDSSVAAYLLNKRFLEYPKNEVVGLHMSNWNAADEDGKEICVQSENDALDARNVCDALNIKMHRASFVSEYWNEVFEPFVEDIGQGKMPNPDVLCNAKVKFGVMKEYAMSNLGATSIATGHYARLWHREKEDRHYPMPYPLEQILTSVSGEEDLSWVESWGTGQKRKLSLPLLLSGADLSKDQSYFLCGVNGSSLNDVIFPLGDLTKGGLAASSSSSALSSSSVREIALSAGLPTAEKRESMGICFIGKRSFPKFISEYLRDKPSSGDFVCVDTGEFIGRHHGSALYTMGQGAKIGGGKLKWFVARKDNSNNIVFICQGTHHPSLYADELYVDADSLNWIGGEIPTPFIEGGGALRAQCRVRHLQPLIPCEVSWDTKNAQFVIKFDRPVRGVTPGQIAALYVANGIICLGGGPIRECGPSYHERGLSLPPLLHPAGINDLSVKHN